MGSDLQFIVFPVNIDEAEWCKAGLPKRQFLVQEKTSTIPSYPYYFIVFLVS